MCSSKRTCLKCRRSKISVRSSLHAASVMDTITALCRHTAFLWNPGTPNETLWVLNGCGAKTCSFEILHMCVSTCTWWKNACTVLLFHTPWSFCVPCAVCCVVSEPPLIVSRLVQCRKRIGCATYLYKTLKIAWHSSTGARLFAELQNNRGMKCAGRVCRPAYDNHCTTKPKFSASKQRYTFSLVYILCWMDRNYYGTKTTLSGILFTENICSHHPATLVQITGDS